MSLILITSKRVSLWAVYCCRPVNLTKAEEQARYIVEHDPNNADGYVLLGNALLAEKHQPEAVDAFTKAISLKPNNAEAYLNRGVVYAYMKQDAMR